MQSRKTKTTKTKTFTESNIVVRFRKMYVICHVVFILRVRVEVWVRVSDSLTSRKGKDPFVFVL